MPTKKKYKHTTARQWGGDDGYCWAVFRKGMSNLVVCGLTRREVAYYRDRIEKQEEEKTMTKTPTLEQRAISALQRTWGAIGFDSLQLSDDGVMSRDEVMEMVSTCGFATGYPMTYGNDKEAVEWLESLNEKEQDRILGVAFPHRTYGM